MAPDKWLQVVLSDRLETEISGWSQATAPQKIAWHDERVFPAYVAAISAFILAIRWVLNSNVVRKLRAKWHMNERAAEENLAQPLASAEQTTWSMRSLSAIGGPVIFAFKLVRLGLVLGLFAAATLSAARARWTQYDCILVTTLAYSVPVAFLNAFSIASSGRVFSLHLSVVTLAVFAVFAYRDIWPLMTFELRPLDEAEGLILWVKVALVGLASIVTPIFEPYPYIPVDPADPYPTPNAEQTASIVSFWTYSFLDPTIVKASRVAHLAYEDFPPLCDYDAAKNLIKQSYSYLDPFSGAKKRHLFLPIAWIFKRTLAVQVSLMLCTALSRLSGPVGMNRLLAYLEREGEDSFVKPWVWVLLVALQPLALSLFIQVYYFLSYASFVRLEGIITSLVFEHALRIRVKAEAATTASPATEDTPTVETPSNTGEGSSAEESGSTEEEDASTLHSKSATADSTVTATSTSTSATAIAGVSSQAKPLDAQKDDSKTKPNANEKSKNFMGKINNLVTSDMSSISNARSFLTIVVSAPLNVTLGMVFLYSILGWSAFVGLAVMLALMPVPAKVTALYAGVQKEKMDATDARVQSVSEMMGVLRMIKLFGWETRVEKIITEKRDKELHVLWRRELLELINTVLSNTIPLVHMVVTYATYTVLQKKPLTASIVFSSMTAFGQIRGQIFNMLRQVRYVAEANVSLGRISDYLYDTELLDEFTEEITHRPTLTSIQHQDDIGFGHATFTWAKDSSDGTATPSNQTFRLHIDQDVTFKKGAFNLIVGPTGSGKTSMLMALLGEVHYIPSGPDSWRSLPRDGGVAYAAQESWVQSETIKENILFNSPYDEQRYKKVLYQCALTRDLSLFEAGDATEVGEKGLTLSGGQKARVTLARAVYSRAKIVLLDDVLAALDVHTSRWIVDKCFKGDLLRGRTVVLVTHNIALAGPIADFVVSLNTDGYIVSQGSIKDAVSKDAALAEEMKHEEEAIELDDNEETTMAQPADDKKGKLIVPEEIAIGHIGWDTFQLFIRGLGGSHPALFWIIYLGINIVGLLFDVLMMWWLGWWTRQYDLVDDPKSVSIAYYLGVYAIIVFATTCSSLATVFIYTLAFLRAARSIHTQLIHSLLGSTFRWMDVTPSSRVIARCTRDMDAVDQVIPFRLEYMVTLTLELGVKLATVFLFAPAFIVPVVPIWLLGTVLSKLYIKAQLSVKREMSNARSPVLDILSGAIAGLASVRAYSAQLIFKNEMSKRIDRYVRISRTLNNLNLWIGVRIDILAALLSAGLTFYLVYGPVVYTASSIGFILALALDLSDKCLAFVTNYNSLEVDCNSLERLEQYISNEREPEPKEGGVPPAYWPASGKLEVENLTARYSLDGPTVLQDVSFRIEGGERVGVVGRTGSGKSTLMLALLRCIVTEGTVVYDGIPAHSLNLDALRSNITVIPQVPELLSGTLRHNVDIFGQFDDATLNEALRAAGLFSLQRLSDENRMTLDTEVAAAGGNLSVGQRQIIALARAIVRQSKLLILDEATSAIDYETDAVIQESLRSELKKDVTVITVAHRLQTIMDSDKVMVLDAGRLVEFDSPKVLLQKEGSLLRALVNESADKETLRAMAEVGSSSASAS